MRTSAPTRIRRRTSPTRPRCFLARSTPTRCGSRQRKKKPPPSRSRRSAASSPPKTRHKTPRQRRRGGGGRQVVLLLCRLGGVPSGTPGGTTRKAGRARAVTVVTVITVPEASQTEVSQHRRGRAAGRASSAHIARLCAHPTGDGVMLYPCVCCTHVCVRARASAYVCIHINNRCMRCY